MKKFLTAFALCGVLAATAIAVSAVASPAQASAAAPNVRCHNLAKAERYLLRHGYSPRIRGGGIFGVVVKSAWVVVHQVNSGHRVYLYAGRSCY